MQFIDDRGFADAGISRDQHQLHRATVDDASGAIWMQIVVSIVGILMMTALAYYRCVYRRTLTRRRRRLSRSSQWQVERHLGGNFGQDQIRLAALF
jgi:hypothetical protein